MPNTGKGSPSRSMKKCLLILAVVAGTVIDGGMEAGAQKKIVQPVGCMDPILRQQADEIKQHYVSQGFVVYRDAMINMSSMEPFPVMVQLMRGQLYEIVFVGQAAATNHKIVMYDGADNKLDERFVTKRHGDDPTNYIIYEFVPERTDTYLLTFMTRLKNKDFCGSVCLLAADRSKGEIKFKPYVP